MSINSQERALTWFPVTISTLIGLAYIFMGYINFTSITSGFAFAIMYVYPVICIAIYYAAFRLTKINRFEIISSIIIFSIIMYYLYNFVETFAYPIYKIS